MEDCADPLRGEVKVSGGDDSDTESFVDAMEELELRNEKPVVFETSSDTTATDSHSRDSDAVDKGETDTIPNNLNKDIGEHSKARTSVPSESSSDDNADDEQRKEKEAQETQDMVNKAVRDDNPADEGVLPDEAEQEINDDIDEGYLKLREAEMTEEEKETKKEEAQSLKAEGNERFKAANYTGALESYTEALMICPLCYAKERSIMYSNRGATKYKMEKFNPAIEDCSKALELNPVYLKALLRRAELYEKTDKLDEALKDYEKCLEMDPSITQARAACMMLPGKIKERNEKMKEEMMGKLKDLGNMILRPFGLSTNNFNLQQDPNTGSYSVQFNQNG